MDKRELQERINSEKIPKDVYSLGGGLPNEKLCLGEVAGKWEVYYSERGEKTGLVTFGSESEACEYFYKELYDMLESTGIKI